MSDNPVSALTQFLGTYVRNPNTASRGQVVAITAVDGHFKLLVISDEHLYEWYAKGLAFEGAYDVMNNAGIAFRGSD
jgi:hypothetical protein